jgi:hypothetical protein
MMAGTAYAQTHDNAMEKIASDVITFTTDVRVGTTVLKAGSYKVDCDSKTMVFTRLVSGKDQEWVDTLDPVERLAVLKSAKALEIACKGKLLSAPSESTVMQMTTEKDGVRTLDKLLLHGSNVEHVFN